MHHMTLNQALHSGQYGPVTGRNRDPNMGNIGAKLRAQGEAALEKVYGGSNITDYATDQGMRGDPNFDKYMANRKYWNMHQVQGAWFSAHGEQGRRWAERQRAADAAQWPDSSAIDKSLRGITGGDLGTANVSVDFKNMPRGVVGNADANGAFKKVQISRSPQAPAAGGAVTTFNEWAFE
jgi:hypothetical protein